MRFECPNCGTITSSSLSLESGGYWQKYNRSGPWGCPSCKERLNLKCNECGAVGNSKTIRGGKCPKCGVISEKEEKHTYEKRQKHWWQFWKNTHD
jgi:hypothetical protein